MWPMLLKMHGISLLNFDKQKVLQNCENWKFEFEMFLVPSHHDPVELQ